MKKIDIEQKYKNDIQAIWRNSELNETEFQDFHLRGYAIQKEIVKDGIVFVGLNPSFDLERKEPQEFFYPLEKDLGRYFQIFPEIIPDNYNWGHIDLLLIRETNQNRIKHFFKLNPKSKFAELQMQFNLKLLEEAKPKLIVVTNTFARTLLGLNNGLQESREYLAIGFEFKEEIGTFIITKGKLKGVPIFFSGMLSGRRALDLGSRQRLTWHIKKVLDYLEKASQ